MRPALGGYVGRRVAVGIRPEQLEDAALVRDGDGRSRLRGRVLLTEALGSELLAHVEVAGRRVVTDEVIESAIDVDEALVEDLALEHGPGENETIFVGRFDAASEVRPDHIVDLVVDTTKLQFFDLETGSAIRESAAA